MKNQQLSKGRVIAAALQKGGVGKTTFSVHTSLFLASLGKSVLLVDADQQGNSTDTIIGRGNHTYEFESKTIVKQEFYTLILDKLGSSNKSPDDAILQTNWPNLDILPTWSVLQMLKGANAALTSAPYAVKDIISEIKALNRYDYIIFDTAPANNMLEQSIFSSCDYVIPITNGRAYADTGYGLLVKTLDEVLKRQNIEVQIPFIVLNAFNKSFSTDVKVREFLEGLKEQKHFNEVFCIPQDQNLNTLLENKKNAFDEETKISAAFKEIAQYIAKEL